MALYIPHSIFHLARLLYVRPETFGPYYVYVIVSSEVILQIFTVQNEKLCENWCQYIRLPVIFRIRVGVSWLITVG